MALVMYLFLLFLPQNITAWVQSALYRHRNSLASYGNFTCNVNQHLGVTKITSFLVEDQFDCTFKCIAEANCNSFNLAAHHDSNGFYLCELLSKDKYRTTASELQANAAFHHFSPWVSRLTLAVCSKMNKPRKSILVPWSRTT